MGAEGSNGEETLEIMKMTGPEDKQKAEAELARAVLEKALRVLEEAPENLLEAGRAARQDK